MWWMLADRPGSVRWPHPRTCGCLNQDLLQNLIRAPHARWAWLQRRWSSNDDKTGITKLMRLTKRLSPDTKWISGLEDANHMERATQTACRTTPALACIFHSFSVWPALSVPSLPISTHVSVTSPLVSYWMLLFWLHPSSFLSVFPSLTELTRFTCQASQQTWNAFHNVFLKEHIR